MRLLYFLPVIYLLVAGDDYVDEVHHRCTSSQETTSCAKYQIFKYLEGYHPRELSLTSDSSVKFITIPGVNSSARSVVRSRMYAPEDSELVKILKFLKRRAAKFVREQGVAVELPEGVEVVEQKRIDEARGKKDKKAIILPLLILIKVFKIKVLVSLILAGVVFIKKILLIAAFILPGVVAAIKTHCKSQQSYHVVPYHVDEDHYTHEHEHEPSGYGFTSYGDKHHYWDRKKHSFF